MNLLEVCHFLSNEMIFILKITGIYIFNLLLYLVNNNFNIGHNLNILAMICERNLKGLVEGKRLLMGQYWVAKSDISYVSSTVCF